MNMQNGLHINTAHTVDRYMDVVDELHLFVYS